MEISKKDLREKSILIRKNIKNKKEKSQIITDKIKNIEEYKNAKIIALYKSLNSEVDTEILIKYSINHGKIVVLPKVENDELKFYKIENDYEKLNRSDFGIEEPYGEEDKYIEKEKIDLVIIPGVAFDLDKNRLGFGKGYYDRFLSNTNLKTIGIFFEEQKHEKIPTEKYDIKMRKIVTDKNIYL